MRRNYSSDFLIHNSSTLLNSSDSFKMQTKAKTAVFLVMIIFSCGLILSMTDALPTPEPDAEDVKLGNNSRLVITHVVKTIEFEVGIVDDVPADDNSTDSDTSEFYETDIQLLNLDLLKQVVSQASEEDNHQGTIEPEQPSRQPVTDSLAPSNQTTS